MQFRAENDTWFCLQLKFRDRIAIRAPKWGGFPRNGGGATPGNGAFV
jgi:hypothetical protein